MNDTPVPLCDPVIYVADDDAAMLRSLAFLFESVGWASRTFSSGHDLLAAFDPNVTGCLVLDIRMPGMSGLEVQHTLTARGNTLPILFITGHGDVAMAVQAMKDGAFDFIEKPFRDQALIEAISRALQESCRRRQCDQRLSEAERKLAVLTQREREVAERVARGLPNKVIARQLAISDKTVQVHRHNVFDKTGTHSAAELARLLMTADPAFGEAGSA